MVSLPEELRWLFWDVDTADVDLRRDADFVIARVVEHGRLADVRWLLATFGRERIHEFFRCTGHPELTPRTIAFWRAYFHAEDEPWPSAPNWRKTSGIPWHG